MGQRRPGMREPDPVAFRRCRVHQSYEIGSIPTPAPEAGQSREPRLHLLARFGGRSQNAAPGEPPPRRAAQGRRCARPRRWRPGRERYRSTPASPAAPATRRRSRRPPAAASAARPLPRGRCAPPGAVPRDQPRQAAPARRSAARSAAAQALFPPWPSRAPLRTTARRRRLRATSGEAGRWEP